MVLLIIKSSWANIGQLRRFFFFLACLVYVSVWFGLFLDRLGSLPDLLVTLPPSPALSNYGKAKYPAGCVN